MIAVPARAIVFAIMLVAFGQPAIAQTAVAVQLQDAVSGAPGVTYADLIREIVPDLRADGDRYVGTKVIALPHIGADDDMQPPEAISFDTGVHAVPLGGTRHLLLVDLGQPDAEAAGFVALALFDTAATPRLLDARNVGFDRFTSFSEPAVRSLGDGSLAMTSSTHGNSNQTYTTTALVLLRGGRLEPVDDVFTFDVQTCAYQWTQRLTIETDDIDPAFHDIEATVTERIQATGEDCGEEHAPEPATHTYIVTYEWDPVAGRYLADSDAFDTLAKANAERF